MSDARSSVFIEEAARLAYRLARSAIRHDHRATWIADQYVAANDGWHRSTGTLPGDVGTGTGGVGLFLAHVAAVTQERQVCERAMEAFGHALAQGDSLLAEDRLGWYDGALGVAGAAMLGGHVSARQDVVAPAVQLAARAVERVAAGVRDMTPRLLDGSAGVLAGLLAVANAFPGARLRERTMEVAATLARALPSRSECLAAGSASHPAGMAVGSSGIGFVLGAWAAHGEAESFDAAAAWIDDERRWFQPGEGWWCAPAHPWHEWDEDSRSGSHRAWCAGAAGIGMVRFVAYAHSREPRFLAEGVAALELVRDGVREANHADASVCHGWAGEIELLLLAASLLPEPVHLDAARSAGQAYVQRAGLVRDYGSGLWPGARTPTLLHGLAGVGLTLLRLHDPHCAPSPALPPCFPAESRPELTR